VQGNGAQTVFNYGFLIPTADAADLYFTDVISGVTYPLPASAWSLSGVNNPLGGTFTYPVSGGPVLQSTQRLTLVRRVPNTQTTSLQNQSGFQPRALERALDWIVMQVQQVANRTQQTIRVPSAEQVLPDLPSAKLRKNTMLSFDANGSPLLLPLQPANNTTIIAQGGTTPRALAVRFSDTKNVADYGVVGDGVADDTAAINALIALVAPNTKLVFAPGAIYRVTGTININRANIHLEGYGAEIRQDTPGIDIIRAGLVGPSGQYDYLFGVSIYGLTCRYNLRTVAAGAAIRMNRCTNYKLIDVFTYDGFNGIVIEGGSYGMLHTPRLTHNTYGVPRGAGSSLLNLKSFDTGSGIQPCYTVNMTNFQLVAPDLSQCVLIQSADGLICSAGYMWGAKDRLVAYDTDNSAAYLAGVRWSNTYFDCGSPSIGTNGHEFANFTGTLGQIYDVVIDSTCLIGNGAGVGVLINRANLGKIRIDAEIINFNSWGLQLYAGSNVELDFGGRIFRSSLTNPSGGLLAQGGKSLRVTGSFTLCGPVALETSGSWELGSIVGASAESTTRDWADTATWARPVQLAGNTSDVAFDSLGSWVQSLPVDGKVSVEDFGAVGDGVTDDGPAFKRAHDYLALRGGGTIILGAKTYRVFTQVVVTAAIIWQGQGFREGPQTNAANPVRPGEGTWIIHADTDNSVFRVEGTNAQNAQFRDMAFWESHPTISAGWTPTVYDWCIEATDTGGAIVLDNVHFGMVYKAVRLKNLGRARLNIQGQILYRGVEADECLDKLWFPRIDFWPFHSSRDEVIQWQQANGVCMDILRVDGIWLNNFFCFGYLKGIQFRTGAFGGATRWFIGDAYFDYTKIGVDVQSSSIIGWINRLTHLPYAWPSGPSISGGFGLKITGSNNVIDIDGANIFETHAETISVEGTGNYVEVGGAFLQLYNTSNTGAGAIRVLSGNAVTFKAEPVLQASAGGTGISSAANSGAVHKPVRQFMGNRAGQGNQLRILATDAAAGYPIDIDAGTSADTNVSIRHFAKGSGLFEFWAQNYPVLKLSNPASAASWIELTGNVAGAAALVQANGAAVNVPILIRGKGVGATILGNAAAPVGFFGSTGGAKPTVSGSRGGNVALASLLTALASLGLITDSTT
jgi:hypothetical protein